MSRLLNRAIRRQKAIRESRDLAWVLFIVMLPIICSGVIVVARSIEVAGTAMTFGGLIAGLVGLIAAWVASHLLREALRLGKLMKNTELIMRSEESADLVSEVQWSRLNPFARPRG